MHLRCALLYALTVFAATAQAHAANLVANPDFDTGIEHWTSGIDQRGVARPQGSQRDIGAVEVPGGRVVPAVGPVCRVSPAGTAAANGNDWAQAMALQTALGTATCTELWVAAGTYLPTLAAVPQYSDRAVSFAVRPGVAVYGGFAGTETQRGQRNVAANRTTLSGDIGVAGTGTDNSFNVVRMDGTTGAGPITASTVLDGFTIRDGYANSNVNYGAGLYCKGSGSGHECSPTLSRLTFSNNTTNHIAGALYNDGRNGGNSSPRLTRVTFSGNTASHDGGAVYNDASGNGTSSPVLGNVTFSGNTTGNTGWGGGMFNDGKSGGVSSPRLVNVTFSGNQAGTFGYGGAMASDGGFNTTAGTCAPLLVNVVAWNDTAGTDPEIVSYQSTTTITYGVVQGGCPHGSACSHLVNAIASPIGTLADNGGDTQTVLLSPGSPAIDAGSDGDCQLSPVDGVDQRGDARPQDAHCDIGAVEMPGDTIFRYGFEQ
ncbi:MAG TPA: choice-of-anchor Q domain-containing protein [Tahibacter sp.]|nr:choice-of-anchor Q domain-containing protein [Tahibacter sp.]